MAYKRHNIFHMSSDCDMTWIKNRVEFMKTQEKEDIILDNIFVMDAYTYYNLFPKQYESKYIEKAKDDVRIRYHYSDRGVILAQGVYNYINYIEFGILVTLGSNRGIGEKKLAVTRVTSYLGDLFDIKNHGYYTILHPNCSYVYVKRDKFTHKTTYGECILSNTPNTRCITMIESDMFCIYNHSLVKSVCRQRIEFSPALTHFGSDIDFLIRSGHDIYKTSKYEVDNSREIATRSLYMNGFVFEDKTYHPMVGKYIKGRFRKVKSKSVFKNLFPEYPEMSYETLSNLKGKHMDVAIDSTYRYNHFDKIIVFTPCEISHPGSIVPLIQSQSFSVLNHLDYIKTLLTKVEYKVLDDSGDDMIFSEYTSRVTPLPYSLKSDNFNLDFREIRDSMVYKTYYAGDLDLHPDLFESKEHMYYFIVLWYYNYIRITSECKINQTSIAEKKLLLFMTEYGMI